MLLRFGDCVLDPDSRELRRASEGVSVGPQVFDLLLHLVENRTRVVSKDELLEVVWRGRIVSESTITSHINAARTAIGDNGQEQRLIRTVARKGFRFVGEVAEVASQAATPDAARSDRSVPLPDKPSIAVLPFVNLSGDPEQDYFADGMVEDIITALSHIRWLFVIARNSSFTYKGRASEVTQIGRDLGVRYVLEGSVRKAANRVRITGQLIDATTGGHLWAERYEGALDDVFELQDRITESVVGAIAHELERAEIERAKRKPTESLDAYDHFLRGMANFHAGTQPSVDQALGSFRKAIALDPEYASAYGMAAWCLFWRRLNGWTADPALDTTEGARLARAAVDLGKNDAVALTRGGHALAHFTRDLDVGIDFLDKALVLNPNLAAAWFLGGYLRIWRGQPEDAITRFEHAMRLSPLDTEMFRMQAGVGMAHFMAGRLDQARVWAEKAWRDVPIFGLSVAVIAASHALDGRQDDARRAMEEFRKLDPALRLGSLEDWLPFERAEDIARFADGLRKAGLPE
ncbi:winged helix-turn-helix domain-containing tetratricopeptide repeat protein [Brevundimonas lenta]|uniref:TolB-like protein n=1 Tax=Brevundimonas lenta TaxID=424796 RepID=A0A7W6JDG8_9CAUL|nr:winged helix-turn-helix domain-containing protein [Brevundimonas lenta]MBB4083125.1 TolB-like protein [Brevundimonas lenta]